MPNINVSLFLLINGLAGKSALLDKIMIFSAKYLIFLVPIFLIFLWFVKGKNNDVRKEALFIFSTALLSFLIGVIIGWFYFHPRPFAMGLGTLLIKHIADSSFPSDHGLVLFSVAFSLLFLKKYKTGVAFMLVGLLVEFARIFVGFHFPADIAGSFVIAFISVGVLYLLKDKLYWVFSKILKVTNKFI